MKTDKSFTNELGKINFASYFFSLNQLPDVRVQGEEFKGNKTLKESVDSHREVYEKYLSPMTIKEVMDAEYN